MGSKNLRIKYYDGEWNELPDTSSAEALHAVEEEYDETGVRARRHINLKGTATYPTDPRAKSIVIRRRRRKREDGAGRVRNALGP